MRVWSVRAMAGRGLVEWLRDENCKINLLGLSSAIGIKSVRGREEGMQLPQISSLVNIMLLKDMDCGAY